MKSVLTWGSCLLAYLLVMMIQPPTSDNGKALASAGAFLFMMAVCIAILGSIRKRGHGD